MEQHTPPPAWLETIGWITIPLAAACALLILFDIYGRGHRQKMPIMEAVHPITALYLGPIWVWFYLRYGRLKSAKVMQRQGGDGGEEDDRIHWYQTVKAVSHCGGGCTLGDIIGEWSVFYAGWMVAGKSLYADFVLDFALAWSFGIVFQYFTIVPMRGLGPLRGIWAAIKADTLSIVAFQVGLFAAMYVYQELAFPHPLPKDSFAYWFLMQVAMVIGAFTAYPVNYLLIKSGVKEKM